MRWLQMFLVGLAMFVCVAGDAEARRRTTRITEVDPVTGVRRTTVVKEGRNWDRGRWNRGRWNRGRGNAWGRRAALGAPVIARRGFPRWARDGSRIWRAGRLWEFDRRLGRWFIVR